MKKRSLMAILALSTVAAYGQHPSLQGAKVTRLQGQVQVKESSVWRLLREGEQLAESTLLKLSQGSRLSLRFRSDGHREEAQGPGELIVGQEDVAGGAKVERFGFRNRPLQIPRSGGLDAVGGSVANAAPRPVHPIAPATPSAAASVLPDLGRSRKGPQFPPALLEPGPAPMVLAWEPAGPGLVDPGAGGIRVGDFRLQAVLCEGDRELARLALHRDQPVRFDEYSLQPDRLYRVEFEEEGVPKGSMTFRLLDSEEQRELLNLALADDIELEQRLERMDHYSDLGEFHLACEEGKRWLFASDPEANPEKTAAVLQVVYDMNRDLLKDARQTEYWQDWAELNKVSLIP
ncbi:MAG: hypothetical protein KIS61_11245 [Candidatus Eremiobacteraeota bacterium]|nr:hypothetical protein [Candidatus Eremiobacteraeota bacterium]